MAGSHGGQEDPSGSARPLIPSPLQEREKAGITAFTECPVRPRVACPRRGRPISSKPERASLNLSAMRIGICSFSFHRLLASGSQDIFGYIDLCRQLGCAQLDPWNAHLAPPENSETVLRAGRNPGQSHQLIALPDDSYIERVAAAGRRAGIPFGTIAVDGAHIFEPEPAARHENRRRAYAWLDAARKLGARQVRIDAGGPEQLSDEVLQIIVDGYRDLIARARPMRIEILIENHWGAAIIPENVVRILLAAPGLGLLYDTRNWKAGLRPQGRQIGAPFARATHVKTRTWDERGNETSEDVAEAVNLLLGAGYAGTWGIESVPEDGDEFGGARKTIELLRRLVG